MWPDKSDESTATQDSVDVADQTSEEDSATTQDAPEIESESDSDEPDEVREMQDDDVVAYIGTDNWRSIPATSWAELGLDGGDVVWGDENGKEIPVAEFNDGQLAWLGAEPDFSIQAPASAAE